MMEYNKLIAEMSLSDEVEGFYVLKAAYPKTTATGKPFLSASLSDRSGSIEIKVWDYSGPISSADEGNVVKIRGTVSEFRGTPQITVDRIRLADDNDTYDLSALVPVAPIDVDTTMAEVERLISSITDADYRKICSTMMARHKESLKTIPAAKSVHHGFISGLLMHTATMMKTADFLAGLYGDIIDRSLLLAGTFLHDFAKEKEFTFSQLGLVTEYSVKGQLLGHLVMGAQEVAAVGDATLCKQSLFQCRERRPKFAQLFNFCRRDTAKHRRILTCSGNSLNRITREHFPYFCVYINKGFMADMKRRLLI